QLAGRLDIIGADKGGPAVVADAVAGKSCRMEARAVAVPYRTGGEIGGDQHAAARIEREGPGMEAMGLDVLHEPRLARRAIKSKNGDVVLAARIHFLAPERARRVRAVGDIKISTGRMHVERAGKLLRA